MAKLEALVRYMIENSLVYLRSLTKFSYITQRIFVYLIYEGFCGQDEKDQD